MLLKAQLTQLRHPATLSLTAQLSGQTPVPCTATCILSFSRRGMEPIYGGTPTVLSTTNIPSS